MKRYFLLIALCGSLSLVCGCASPRSQQAPPQPTAVVSVAPAPPPAPLVQSSSRPPTTRAAADLVDPRQVVPFLASDAMAGRAPGTDGIVRAGDFISQEFQRIGLEPLPSLGGFFQPFVMPLATTISRQSLSVEDRPLLAGNDFVPMGISGQGKFAGEVVFAGYGISRADYDDYAGIDVHGKVVLAMRLEPRDADGKSRFASGYQQWSSAAAVREKAKLAAEHGASALLLVSPPAAGGQDTLASFSADSSAADIPVLAITRRVADVLLTTANQPDLATLARSIDMVDRPHSLTVGENASGEVALARHSADVRNVIAVLPGSGPHADEWVIVGAHYDHLGTGQLGHLLGGAGAIYHGADDNASGVAAVLELAERMKLASPPPRSILFCCFSGEEEGLLGSDWFVKHPPVPLDHVVAMLNLDMVGRLHNDNLLVGGWGTAANFDAIVNDAIAGTGLHRASFEKGGLGPSDHMSFALAHIPVLFYFTGLHADYHRPTDTAEKINYAGIDEIVEVCQRTVSALAAMPRQQYDASSDGDSVMAAMTGHGAPGRGKAVLGIVPDFSAFDVGNGVRISDVGAGSPAAAAGLKSGDVLTRFGSQQLVTLQDLSDALAVAKPGDRVAIGVLRDGKTMAVQAVLGERGGGE